MHELTWYRSGTDREEFPSIPPSNKKKKTVLSCTKAGHGCLLTRKSSFQAYLGPSLCQNLKPPKVGLHGKLGYYCRWHHLTGRPDPIAKLS